MTFKWQNYDHFRLYTQNVFTATSNYKDLTRSWFAVVPPNTDGLIYVNQYPDICELYSGV